MKKFLALLLLLLLCVSPALADQNRVIDDADVLSSSEEATLEQAITLVRETHQFDVVLLTKTSIDGREARYYAGDYYDDNGFGYNDTHDGIILLLVVGAEAGNRDYTIVMTGRGETVFDDDAVYAIEDDILPALRSSSYTTAMARFVRDVEARLSYYAEYYHPVSRTKRVAPILILVGAAIGAAVAFALKSQMKSVRRRNGASSYVREGSFQLNRVQDIYLYTTTTRRRIETPSSSGGGHSGGFTSSSGTHHTSHSGKF